MKHKSRILPFAILAIVLLNIVALPFSLFNKSQVARSATRIQGAAIVHNSTPTAFMHRPFYGSQTVSQRTTSFVDHDKPWYENDGIFVRYDGAKWTNASIGSCTGGVNCYDGHNGYDLNLWYEPVLSTAAGTVIRAGWYNPYDHQSALGLWAAVDHGNGYVTAYGHLSALTVAIGDRVGTQWQLGTSGTTGSSTGPHLHMATYYLPNWNATDPFGWTGSYADPNVVPDNYLWVSSPGTSYTVPNLSGSGSAVYPGAAMVDDGNPGWSSTGTWTQDSSSTAINGDLRWAPTSSGTATATATWQPKLPADGYYEVGVFVNDTHASSSWAPYTVYSADPNHPGSELSHMVYVDETHIGSFQGPYNWQNTGPQWVSLGTYYFRAAQAGRVMLSNATGENGVQVSADGVEFAPVSGLGSPAPTPTYGFSITSDGTPAAMLPGSTTNVNMTFKNTSNFTWKASGSAAVQVLYRWLNAQKQIVATSNPIALPEDVNTGATTTISVPVRTPAQYGTYTLQWDMQQNNKAFSQQGAQVTNDPVLVARYSETFGPAPLPTTLIPAATVQVTVNVQNKGPLPWPASGNARVTLSYRWLDANGHAVSSTIAGTSSTGTLPADVAPGHSTAISIAVHAPVLAGNYQLVYDLQQQGTWFSSQGATPLTQAVTITPILPQTYYFAEGYTGAGTSEYLSLTNPTVHSANVSVTYLYSNASPRTRIYTVPAQSHSVLNINAEAGAGQTVSMIVRSDQPFVAERSMYIQKRSFVDATDSVGSPVLSTHWYFAEANTTYGWNTLLAVLNPSSQPVTLKVAYLLSSRANGTPTGSNNGVYTIPAHSRSTIVLNSALPNRQFGMAITASAPVAIERPEYLVQSSLRGGNSVVGALAPQTSWYFAGGNTTPGFTESLVLANPSLALANVQIRYLTTTGQVVTQRVTVPGLSRIEVNVNRALRSSLHATVLSSSTPIVAERQDFFVTHLNGTIFGSSTTVGISAPHSGWYVAHGDTASGHAEYLALANPNAVQAQVQVVYYLASGTPLVKTYILAANSRLTINMLRDVGANPSVGTAVYTTVPVVLEQTMFFNLHGISGGYSSGGYGQ